MRIALFSTCIGDALFPDASKATAVILSRLGHEVVFPEGQTCCGQMHVNTGYQREIIPQIRDYVDAFSDPSIDYVIAPSGSCTGAVRHQHQMVAERYGDKALVDGVKKTAPKTLDLSEFLVDIEGKNKYWCLFPPPRDVPLNLPLAAHGEGGRPPLPAAQRGQEPGSCPPAWRGGMLRIRRNVLGEERGYVGRHGGR